MAGSPVSGVMSGLLTDLNQLLDFVLNSKFTQVQGDPGISDFVFGNPHEMPLTELSDAIARWSVPQNKDWFAYKMSELPAMESVARSLRASHELAFEPEDVFLTTGAFGAISVCLRTFVDAGDEVIFLSPPWFFYEPMIKLIGAVPVRVTLPPPTFDLDLDAIAAAITPRTRAIIVNSPNNPSGKIYSRESLDALGALLSDASARHGRRIIQFSDEAYRRILFDGRAFHTPAASYPDTTVMYTYGKTLLAPGQRMGYIALPPQMPDREQIREAMFLAQVVGGWQFPNAVLQYALPDLEDVSIDVGALQHRRDRLHGALTEMGYEVVLPESTFYMLVRSPIPDDVAFTAMLTEHDVYVGPGVIFEVPGYFRISVTANDDMVERSLPGFAKALEQARA